MNPPPAVLTQQIDAAAKKASLPLGRLFALGAMAGAFIALGAATSSTAAHAVANAGLARLVCGCVFPVGLLLVVFLGAELFTGNNLMAMAAADRRIGCAAFLRNLAVVWPANLAGAALIAWLAARSGTFALGGGALGAYTIKVAAGKAALAPSQAFASGVLCNILVCTALLAGTASKHLSGKAVAIYIPIFAFVVGGYEHCVANMYYLLAGVFAGADSSFAGLAAERWGIAAPGFAGVAKNLLFSTLGNLAGGIALVAIPFWYCRRSAPEQ